MDHAAKLPYNLKVVLSFCAAKNLFECRGAVFRMLYCYATKNLFEFGGFAFKKEIQFQDLALCLIATEFCP
jgi:hypothetical protein